MVVRSSTPVSGFDLPPADEVLPPYNNKPQLEWHPMTVRWWNNWRRSPQAARMLSEPDWDYLLDTALMHHVMWVSGNFERAAEVRIRVSNFGATPLDRLRLKLEIETPEQAPAGSGGHLSVVESIADRRVRIGGAS
jgi:hypothetical protein